MVDGSKGGTCVLNKKARSWVRNDMVSMFPWMLCMWCFSNPINLMFGVCVSCVFALAENTGILSQFLMQERSSKSAGRICRWSKSRGHV